MSFEVTAITTMAEIPGHVLDFAENTLGWTVTGSLMTIPGGEDVQMDNIVSTTYPRIEIKMPDLSATKVALFEQPRLLGTPSAPVLPDPTNLYLYGGTEESAPFLAGIVEFGYNRYRHFYIGSMIKVGAYTGGDIIQAGAHGSANGSQPGSRFIGQMKFPFACGNHDETVSFDQAGYVNVVHADAGSPLKTFRQPNPSIFSFDGNALGDIAIGGWGDRVNSCYEDKASQHFAAASVLGPINCFVQKTGLARYYPIGRVPGVRMVAMDNIEPGALITVGAEDWRVFPVFRRSAFTSVSRNANQYNSDETSFRRGLAYPES